MLCLYLIQFYLFRGSHGGQGLAAPRRQAGPGRHNRGKLRVISSRVWSTVWSTGWLRASSLLTQKAWYYIWSTGRRSSGFIGVFGCFFQLPKLDVVGSNPIARFQYGRGVASYICYLFRQRLLGRFHGQRRRENGAQRRGRGK